MNFDRLELSNNEDSFSAYDPYQANNKAGSLIAQNMHGGRSSTTKGESSEFNTAYPFAVAEDAKSDTSGGGHNVGYYHQNP